MHEERDGEIWKCVMIVAMQSSLANNLSALVGIWPAMSQKVVTLSSITWLWLSRYLLWRSPISELFENLSMYLLYIENSLQVQYYRGCCWSWSSYLIDFQRVSEFNRTPNSSPSNSLCLYVLVTKVLQWGDIWEFCWETYRRVLTTAVHPA